MACATLSSTERAQLLDWTRSRTLPHRLVVRSRIILLASTGLAPRAIANRLGVSAATVRLWCDRFSRGGVGSLAHERPGRGRRPGRSTAIVLAILRGMRSRAEHQPRWTTRTLAAAVGTSAVSVWRIWKQYRLGPSSSAADIGRALAQAIDETSSAAK